MELMKKTWNHQLSNENRRSIKQRAIKGLVWLVLLMVACTIIARAADSMTVALVGVASPKRTNIGHTVQMQGSLKASGDVPVVSASNMLVLEIPVQKGDQVAKGDLLFAYDVSDIEDKIAQKEQDIEKKKLELRALKKNKSVAKQENETQAWRTLEDYNLAIEEADIAIKQAQEDLNGAQAALSRYQNETPPEEYSAAQEISLRDAITQRERSLESAQRAKQDTMRSYERKLQDLNDETVDNSVALTQMDYDALLEELEELKLLLEGQGQVLAPMDGIVTGIEVSVGSFTGSGAAVFLNDGKNMVFEGSVSKEQEPYLEIGGKMGVRLTGGKETLEFTIDSIEPTEDDPDQYLVRASVPDGAGMPGTAGSAEIRHRSGTYETCVPLSALYKDNNQYYVLTVREVETTLGTELVAERVDVTVDDKNETTAAVSGAIYPDSRVITESSKPISDGDRVRLNS